MASGGYARKTAPRDLDSVSTRSPIPQRSTRQLPALTTRELEDDRNIRNNWDDRVVEVQDSPFESLRLAADKTIDSLRSLGRPRTPLRYSAMPETSVRRGRVVSEFAPHPLERHRVWLNKYVLGTSIAIIFALVLLTSALVNRPGGTTILTNIPGLGQVYSVQVGGAQAAAIQNTNGPVQQQVPLHTGPYSVLSKPTITADFINQVLSAYGSPAAGKGQQLYDLGVQYGIDPAFALAFFQHESTFGKFGEANTTRSLGNLRCIPNAACINSSGQTCAPGDSCYASFPTWEAGFEAWYKLIRNLYVAGWGLSTIPQIIPKYAPSADNNNEAAYIASVEHSIDVWHSGQIFT
ncbi:MAG TPA: hypothetical protein DHW02_18250 [Ktedonobacter sp.]|nr:hypothetical protein [Ktedonobacter sp.]